jgi:hypothetical protein
MNLPDVGLSVLVDGTAVPAGEGREPINPFDADRTT